MKEKSMNASSNTISVVTYDEDGFYYEYLGVREELESLVAKCREAISLGNLDKLASYMENNFPS